MSVNVDITTSGSPSAGEIFSLECSISGTSDDATFQWLRGSPDNRTQLTSDGSRAINSTSPVSQLQFSPLRASRGGLYTCQVMVEGGTVEKTTTVQVNREYIVPNFQLIKHRVSTLTLLILLQSQAHLM